MKLTKIFSVVTCSALALAGAFMFASCDGNIGSDDISVTEGGASASINATNESTTDYRRTLTKSSTFSKKEVTSTITFENQTSSSENGAMGIAFDYHAEKDDDGDTVYNFGVVALKAASGKLVAYISYYTNVGGDYVSGSASNFCDKNGVKIGDTGCLAKEYKVLPTMSDSNSWSTDVNSYGTFDESAGTLVSTVNIAVQSDGSFVVKIAKDTSSLSGTENTDYVSYTVAHSVDDYYTTSVTVEKAVTFAYYANVYRATSSGSNTLKGNWSTPF